MSPRTPRPLDPALVRRLCTPVTPEMVRLADLAERAANLPPVPPWAVLSRATVLCLALMVCGVGFLFVRSFV